MNFFVFVVCVAIITVIVAKNTGMMREPSPNRIFGGVCAGIARHFDISVGFVRVLWLVWVLCGGGGLVSYLVVCAIVPVRRK